MDIGDGALDDHYVAGVGRGTPEDSAAAIIE